jgi:streptogramin lyase
MRGVGRTRDSGALVRLAVAGLLAGACAVAPAAAASPLAVFVKGINGGSVMGITAGPDGNLWFTYAGQQNAIGRLTPAGDVLRVTDGALPRAPASIATGPDGNLWFTDQGDPPAIGRMTTGGLVNEFSAGLRPGSLPGAITPGPDGAMWFVDGGYYGAASSPAIGRISPSGEITEFSAGLQPGNRSSVEDITAGPDGNLWFTDSGGTPAIGRITPDGQITEFARGLQPRNASFPSGIAAGPDGNLWFTDDGATEAIGRITPDGQITEFTRGLQPGSNSRVVSITAGPDANMWFTDYGLLSNAVGRITPSGQIDEFPVTLEAYIQAPPSTITAGPDGGVWFAGRGAVGRIDSHNPPQAVNTLRLNCGLIYRAFGKRKCHVSLVDRPPNTRTPRGSLTATLNLGRTIYASGIARYAGPRLFITLTNVTRRMTALHYGLTVYDGHTRHHQAVTLVRRPGYTQVG